MPLSNKTPTKSIINKRDRGPSLNLKASKVFDGPQNGYQTKVWTPAGVLNMG